MRFAPLPDPLAIVRTTEVIFIPRPLQPTPLTIRLGSAATVGSRTISLPSPIAGIRVMYFIAMEALKGEIGLHERSPCNATTRPPRRSKSPPPPPKRKPEGSEETERRRELCGRFRRRRQHPLNIGFSIRLIYPIFTSPPARRHDSPR